MVLRYALAFYFTNAAMGTCDGERWIRWYVPLDNFTDTSTLLTIWNQSINSIP